MQVCILKKFVTRKQTSYPFPYTANYCLCEAAVRGLIFSGYPSYTRANTEEESGILCAINVGFFLWVLRTEVWLRFLNSWRRTLLILIKFRILKMKKVRGNVLKVKKVIWTVLIMSSRKKKFRRRIGSKLSAM